MHIIGGNHGAVMVSRHPRIWPRR